MDDVSESYLKFISMAKATIWFKLAGKTLKVNTLWLTTSGALKECREFCDLKTKALDQFFSLDLKKFPVLAKWPKAGSRMAGWL